MDPAWSVRRRFWDALALVKYRASKPLPIPVPKAGERPLKAVPLVERVPEIPIRNIPVADGIPADEASARNYRFFRFQVAMYRLYPPMRDGVPAIDPDPERALSRAYSAAHRRLFPAPELPATLEHLDLGRLAVASPYACHLSRGPEDTFQWDFGSLGSYEIHDGLVPLGVRVRFEVDADGRRLRAAEIESELGRSRPGESGWDRARRLALCAATTHTSLVRHYNWVHLTAGAAVALAVRNDLPVTHPVQRLLWPHVYRTQYSNHITTLAQLTKGGDFESTFSFTHRGVCALFEETYEAFDAGTLDPAADADRRGIRDAGFDTPALDNHLAVFDVMVAHARGYLRAYYPSDSDLAADEQVQAWLDHVDRLLPGGVRVSFGGARTVDDTGRLIGAFIYLAAVQHDVFGTGLWNYQLWPQVNPVRVYKSDQRVPVDVYQRLINANFILNIHRSALMQDFSYLAVDPRGADAFRAFLTELQGLQARIERENPPGWEVSPANLEANING